MTVDNRDRLIAECADSEFQLAHQLAVYREMLSVALAQLHERGRQLERLREQQRQLRREYRQLRQTILRDEGRAAA